MSLKKAEKPQDVLYIKVASINTESQKTPAECRILSFLQSHFYDIKKKNSPKILTEGEVDYKIVRGSTSIATLTALELTNIRNSSKLGTLGKTSGMNFNKICQR